MSDTTEIVKTATTDKCDAVMAISNKMRAVIRAQVGSAFSDGKTDRLMDAIFDALDNEDIIYMHNASPECNHDDYADWDDVKAAFYRPCDCGDCFRCYFASKQGYGTDLARFNARGTVL